MQLPDEIRKANEIMARGKKDEAKSVLQSLLQGFPKDQNLYQDAVNIYMAGKMYEEAKTMFALYERETGQNLHADFTLDGIVREQIEHETLSRGYAKADTKIFKRMSFSERGRFSQNPSLFPIREIRITREDFLIMKGRREYRFRWPEILDARIILRKGYKGYQFSDDIVRTLVLKTRDQSFKINVSANFPDFEGSDMLVNELRQHLEVLEVNA